MDFPVGPEAANNHAVREGTLWQETKNGALRVTSVLQHITEDAEFCQHLNEPGRRARRQVRSQARQTPGFQPVRP